MKIFICFDFKNGLGGGNQFLKGLKEFLSSSKLLAHTALEADVILFNSHHSLNELLRYYYKYPEKKFLHRIDGPISLYSGNFDFRDSKIYFANYFFADATIFQSEWSKEQNIKMNIFKFSNSFTIKNAPSDIFFERKEKQKFIKTILSTSWSGHENKGRLDYKWLDENLDFTKYEYIFIGNINQNFKNIKVLPPCSSEGIKVHMSKADVFISCSKNEACSNAILEALANGIPVIGHASGSTPELILEGGKKYSDIKEVPELLEEINSNYDKIQRSIKVANMSEVGNLYIQAATSTPKIKHNFRIIRILAFISLDIFFKLLNKVKGYNFLLIKKISNK